MAHKPLTDQFKQQLQGMLNTLPVAPSRILIAFSGGRDSVALLHLTAQTLPDLLPDTPILALHINHQLSENAQAWQQHCQAQAENLSVDFKAVAVNLDPQPRQSLEELAREARYQVFADHLAENDLLLVGHHQQDQSETLLLRLFRGSGVHGMAAMAEQRPFAKGWLLRPMLGFSREQLTDWLTQQDIPWIEDESNAQNLFRRNHLRNQLLPEIRSQWQGIDRVLNATAKRMQQSAGLLDQLADLDLANALQPGNRLDLSELKKLDLDRLQNLLRYWLRKTGPADLKSLPEIRLFEFARQLKNASGQSNPRQELGNGWFAACYGQLLWLVDGTALENAASRQKILWNPSLQAQLDTPQFRLIAQENLPDVELTVAFGAQQQKLQVSTNVRFESVGRLMNQAGIPPWYRDVWPLVFDDHGLVAIAGVRMAIRTDQIDYKILCNFFALPTFVN